MKILLLQPPVEDFYDTEIRHFPLGLAYLKASINQIYSDVSVKIIDFHHGYGRRTVPVPPEFKYLEDYFPWPDDSPFCLFHNYYHFGADYEDIARQVKLESPDLVGISSMFSAYHREVLKTAAAIRKEFKVPIVVGGAHASAMPELMLADENIDYVVIGEGEQPLVSLVGFLQGASVSLKAIPGLAFRDQGAVVINQQQSFSEDIDVIPFPDCSDWDVEKYQLKKRPLCFVITSRGCPYRCSFCSVRSVFCRKYSRRSNKNIIGELMQRYETGYRCFDFEDDNLAFEREEFEELLTLIVKDFPDVELTAMNGINYTHLDSSLLKLMYEAGFRQINLSLVAEDQSECHGLSRFHEFLKFEEIVTEAKNIGFSIVAYLIMGFPQQSLESAINSLVSLAKLPVLIGASPFYLAPGSELFGLSKRPAAEAAFFARLSALNHEHSLMTREELYSLFVLTRIINFLKSLPENTENLTDRRAIGLSLIKRLNAEGILYASTREGLKPLTRFSVDVFRLVFSRLESVPTFLPNPF